eukprot:Pgem_evm1s13650
MNKLKLFLIIVFIIIVANCFIFIYGNPINQIQHIFPRNITKESSGKSNTGLEDEK